MAVPGAAGPRHVAQLERREARIHSEFGGNQLVDRHPVRVIRPGFDLRLAAVNQVSAPNVPPATPDVPPREHAEFPFKRFERLQGGRKRVIGSGPCGHPFQNVHALGT